MQLTHTVIAESPLGPDRVRLSGHVQYDQDTPKEEIFWFDANSACSRPAGA